MSILLTIAGFDPSSGAGVTADLATFAAHGFFGTACITALTVQSTTGVSGTQPIAHSLIAETLNCLQDDLPPDGIKIGMLANAANLETVAAFLEVARAKHPRMPVVLDPVLRSSSGRDLLDPLAVDLLRTRLFPLVDWITPNLEELAVLARAKYPTSVDAARYLQHQHPHLGVIVTGGHADPPDDVILEPKADPVWLTGTSLIRTRSTHGTGCAFSSAFLSNLVLGSAPLNAAHAAKRYVYRAIESAPGLGAGRGPLNHLWTRPLQKTSDLP